MTNVKILAGIDVSKAYFDVCLCSDTDQQSRRFTYDHQGLKELSLWLPVGIHCVMEFTGPYYLKLAVHLHEHGFLVSVVNPLVIKRFSQMRLLRAKTDKADAKMIAAYGLKENPSIWHPPAAYVIKLQQMQAMLDRLQKHRTATLCQVEAFTASGIFDKELRQSLKKDITHFDKQIESISVKMETIIEQHHQQMVKSLVSIPGLGKKTSVVLIVISGGFSKFSNCKQLSAYVGLSPRIYDSGSSVKGRARICKMGMSRIRALLYVCAWSAKRCNNACKELYERLVAKGKSKRLALIAVGNKLLKQAFAIATNSTLYNNNYSKNICL